MNMAKIVHEWYQNGWVMLDAATTTETNSGLMRAGNLSATCRPSSPASSPRKNR